MSKLSDKKYIFMALRYPSFNIEIQGPLLFVLFIYILFHII